MNDPPPDRARPPDGPNFEANLVLVDREIRPGRTLTYLAEVDLSQVERLRDRWPGPTGPSLATFVVKALARALRDFPDANRRSRSRGSWPSGRPKLQEFAGCDVAVAVEREARGSAPTTTFAILHDADEAPIDEIARALRALDARASAACCRPGQPRGSFAHLIRRLRDTPGAWARDRGGAALVCAPDRSGVDAVLGTWPHPIGVSFGQVRPRPVAVGTAVEVRPAFFLSLNFDRRVMIAMQAARFLRRMVDFLENAGDEMAPFLTPDARVDFPTVEVPEIDRGSWGREA